MNDAQFYSWLWETLNPDHWGTFTEEKAMSHMTGVNELCRRIGRNRYEIVTDDNINWYLAPLEDRKTK